jgi:tetratricopeptide (TPR) repeat protein
MELPASTSQSTGLSLSRRLKRALLIALLLGLWAPFKIAWEQKIASEQDFLRYRGFTMTRHLRDELGQGLTIGVLSGMRSVVADLVWFNVTLAWMNEQWFRMGPYINLCMVLQPRATVFPDMGGWHLAWNASVAAMEDRTQPNELRRLKAKRFWIDRGLEIYLRGIANNPEYWRLWADTGILYDQRLKDYPKAAEYYQRASELPNAPIYLERFSAIMYDDKHAKNDQAAYERWVALWKRLTPEQRAMKFHEGDRIESEIRKLEQKLSIPNEKRVFPN